MVKSLKLAVKNGRSLVNIIAIVGIVWWSSFNCYAKSTKEKHIFNPKIERRSFEKCGECRDCGTMGGCATVYIYIYPKNIDKMIEENPEFKKEITQDIGIRDDMLVRKLKEPNEYGNIYTNEYLNKYYNDLKNADDYNNLFENPNEIIKIRNCYNLWKYDPFYYDTMHMKIHMTLEQHCNEIVKKVLKKRGRLY